MRELKHAGGPWLLEQISLLSAAGASASAQEHHERVGRALIPVGSLQNHWEAREGRSEGDGDLELVRSNQGEGRAHTIELKLV